MYLLSDDSKELLADVKNFCKKEVMEQSKEYDISGEWPAEIYAKAFDMGLQSLEIPEELGGVGLDSVTLSALYEEMAYADAGFATTMACNNLCVKPIMRSGNAEQKKFVADLVLAGKIGAFALTEPMCGSDVGSTKTTAVYDAATDEYVINGRKCFITNAAVASIFYVTASTDKTKGAKGLSGFIVESGTKGLSIGEHENKMGIRLSTTSDVLFEDVRVPAKNLVGKEGDGFKIAMQTLDGARPFVGSLAVGVAKRALDESIAYAKERVTFGKPISKFQALQFMMADMDISIETARQMVVHSLTLLDAGMPFSREAAIAKCYAGDMSVQVALDAIQIMGGFGYSREYPVEKLLRDAKIFQLYEGTNQIQRIVIAGSILR
jgi:Acyl-CoA dehydrogenases